MNISELEKQTITELHKLARDLEISGYAQMRKKDLIFALLKREAEKGGNIFTEGVLEVVNGEGYGFCVLPNIYLLVMIFISPNPRSGVLICGQVMWFQDR